MTDQFRPELFDDSEYVINGKELGVFKLFFSTQHAIIDFSVKYTAQAICDRRRLLCTM
jgi:hypothetical protein